jgi:serine/threonine protein kinase
MDIAGLYHSEPGSVAAAEWGPEDDGGAPPADEAAPWSADPSRYAVGAEIVRGGMGRIRSAWDRRLRRPVAIKELLYRDARAERRFLREALITARLQHPAIVPVYEAGRWRSGRPFYVMKMVAGMSLDERIAAAGVLEGRLALLPNVIAVAEAIAYAHSQGIVHRDLKPANVLVGPFGETVVIDWGLAKDLSAPTGVSSADSGETRREGTTAEGSVLGTPAYMSPEQARGEPVDRSTDVYALGALLYHVLTGGAPYSGKDARGQLLAGPPMRVEVRDPRVPPDLAAIVAKAMARVQQERFETAKELANAVMRWQAGQRTSIHRHSARAAFTGWLRRRGTAFGLALAGRLRALR